MPTKADYNYDLRELQDQLDLMLESSDVTVWDEVASSALMMSGVGQRVSYEMSRLYKRGREQNIHRLQAEENKRLLRKDVMEALYRAAHDPETVDGSYPYTPDGEVLIDMAQRYNTLKREMAKKEKEFACLAQDLRAILAASEAALKDPAELTYLSASSVVSIPAIKKFNELLDKVLQAKATAIEKLNEDV
jgi:hypothetical protein